jgi:uncharacterized lipoprotein YddW (UPF0748 family)
MGGKHLLVGALGDEGHEKRKKDGAVRQQRYRAKLALEGLTPLNRLSEEALANQQQMQDSRQWIGGAAVKQPVLQLYYRIDALFTAKVAADAINKQ